jgi:hypothetical protein
MESLSRVHRVEKGSLTTATTRMGYTKYTRIDVQELGMTKGGNSLKPEATVIKSI